MAKQSSDTPFRRWFSVGTQARPVIFSLVFEGGREQCDALIDQPFLPRVGVDYFLMELVYAKLKEHDIKRDRLGSFYMFDEPPHKSNERFVVFEMVVPERMGTD